MTKQAITAATACLFFLGSNGHATFQQANIVADEFVQKQGTQFHAVAHRHTHGKGYFSEYSWIDMNGFWT